MTVHERAAETYKTLNDAGRSHDECLHEAVNAALAAVIEVIKDNDLHCWWTSEVISEIRALSDGGQNNEG